jgi:hypothetical protein
MAEYATFDDMVSSLPQAAVSPGNALDAFRVVETIEPYVEPLMSQYEVTAAAQTTFISARGASGKSAMAAQLSRRLSAPLWSLGEDKAVSGDALTARLSAYLGAVDPLTEARSGRVPVLIIDAMDEARLRVTGLSWDDFMASLVQYAHADVHLVILGRKRTVEDVWYSLADADVSVSWYEISHFNPDQQGDYVDLRALRGRSSARTHAYVEARNAVLTELNGANDAALDEAFAGYAPVLDAVAALLKPPANYQAILNDFRSSGAAGTRLKVLRRILQALLNREQSKVAPLAGQLGVDATLAYSPSEQLDWLALELLGGSVPSLDWCPHTKRTEYIDLLAPFLLDHPFREGEGWASPVFSSYSALMRIGDAEPESLLAVAGLSGLFFEYAVAEAAGEPLVIDEPQFSAMHASLMAGQWHSSTSVVSVRSEPSRGESSLDSATARLVLLQPDNSSTTLDASVVIDQAGMLQLVSPLANIDVDFPGSIVVSSTSTSIDLGPEVFLRARSIELTGASLQVSKDTSAGEVAGPTVELEASESFVTHASLIGSVTAGDLSIVVPPSHKLNYPWIQFRTDPDDDENGADADNRARRLLNKLMSLARRHGHGGLRAVYIKKLEGRQGLGAEEFQRAIAVLVGLGVVRAGGDMLFLDEEWDGNRYDGKGREGMPSYEDKRDVWDPVVKAVSAVLG